MSTMSVHNATEDNFCKHTLPYRQVGRMLIERLHFRVNPPEFVKDFLLSDSMVWTPWLQRQVGYVKKDTRILRNGEVEILVFWDSEENFEKASAKKAELATVENLMRSRTPGTYHLFSSSTL